MGSVLKLDWWVGPFICEVLAVRSVRYDLAVPPKTLIRQTYALIACVQSEVLLTQRKSLRDSAHSTQRELFISRRIVLSVEVQIDTNTKKKTRWGNTYLCFCALHGLHAYEVQRRKILLSRIDVRKLLNVKEGSG